MLIKDLENILKVIPILFVDGIVFKKGNNIYKAKGISVKKERPDKTMMRYIALDHTCDNLAKGLLYESLHHCYSWESEEMIKNLTDLFWDEMAYRKLVQNKIVKLLENYNL